VGPVHKSDVGGVVLNVKDIETVTREYNRLINIPETYAVEICKMYKGTEVFIGASKEEKFGHQVLFGLGGIFIEVLKDVQASLVPVNKEEAKSLLKNLRGYKILQGVRGQEPVNEEILADIVARVSALVQVAPEIVEMDLNPLLGTSQYVIAVDARIRVEK
jgi:acetyltransferase